MAIQNGNAHAADLGLRSLALFLRLHGVNAEPDQLRERCGESAIGIRAMLRCARDFGLKVRSRTTHWKQLAGISLPGIAALRDGGFLLLGKVEDDACACAASDLVASEVDAACGIRRNLGRPLDPDRISKPHRSGASTPLPV